MKESETPKDFSSLRPSPEYRGGTLGKLKIFRSFALLVIFFVFLFFIPPKHNLADIKGIKIAGQGIKVDLALTNTERERGLSGRTSLKENEGMLFVFSHPNNYPFWMKDMNFPIDIIWIGKNMKVIYIKKDARPERYPEIYDSVIAGQYILEVISGFSDKSNLKVGDRVEFMY